MRRLSSAECAPPFVADSGRMCAFVRTCARWCLCVGPMPNDSNIANADRPTAAYSMLTTNSSVGCVR